MKNKALGRGLDALLSNNEDFNSEGQTQLKMMSINKLSAGKYQPRSIMNSGPLEELAESIKAQGIMQPILVRKTNEDAYEIVAGERRWRAAKLANLFEVPVIIKEIPDASALAMALIENIQREDLNVIEEAKGIKRLIDEFDMTHEGAAEALGKSRTAVSNILRLLNLSDHVQNALLSNKIEMGHARALLTLEPSAQVMYCQKIIGEKLSVRDVEAIVANQNQNKHKKIITANTDVKNLEDELADKLGMTIKISHQTNGKGAIKIHYRNLDELDKVLEKLKN